MIRRTLLSLVLAAAAAVAARADGPGTSAGAFLAVPVGARAIGMGGAYAAHAGDPWATFYNPGGLGRVGAPEAAFQHHESVLDIDQEYLAVVHPWGRGAVGIAWNRFDYGTFQRTVITSGTTFASRGTFDALADAVSLGYGWRVGGVAVGLQGKWIRERLAEYDADAVAIDLGLHWRDPGGRLEAGLAVQNLGSDLSFRSRDDRLPYLVRLGVGYSVDDRFRAGLDVERAVNSDAVVRLGGEYWIAPFLALRAGFDSSSDEGNEYALGVGFRRHGLAIDYAFTDEDALGTTHRVSAGYRWGLAAEGEP